MEKQKVNFVLNEGVLSENVDNFTKIGQVYYPLKSNSNEVIIEELVKLFEGTNNGFLVTYRSHFEKLISLGVSPDRIGIVNVLADDEDLEYYYNNGVRYFTFGNADKLNKFLEYADPADVKISIRLNIKEPFEEVLGEKKIHLGAKTDTCKRMFDTLNEHGINNYGISFYLQKELLPQPDVLNHMLDYIEENFDGYKFRFINIGGALKAHKIDQDKLNETREKMGADYIIVEPGRYMVGNAGYMETTIEERNDEDDIIIVKNGIYGGLLDAKLYGKTYSLVIPVEEGYVRLSKEEIDENGNKRKGFTICGGSSDSGDCIGEYFIDETFADRLQPGSKIIVLNALTYVEEFMMKLGGDLEPEYHIVNCKTNAMKR